MNENKVTSISSRRGIQNGGNNGNGSDARLRSIEDRLTQLETHFGYLAKKEDIKGMETTLLRWQIGIVVVVIVTLVSVIFKLLP